MTVRIYLIDGVAVPKRVWERRREFGEHAAAQFTTYDVTLKGKKEQQTRGGGRENRGSGR